MSTNTTSFNYPPLDALLTVDQFYDWHRVHSPDFPAFVFPDEQGQKSYMTWKSLGEGVARSVALIRNQIPEIQTGNPGQSPIVVGVLATANTITYTTFLFAHLRLTHPSSGRRVLPFLISTRNSVAAVAHLIRATDTKYLWVTDGPMTSLANDALSQSELADVQLLPMPSFIDAYPETISEDSVEQLEENQSAHAFLDEPAVMLHSSGSTSFPKPRTLTHRMLIEWSKIIAHGELDLLRETMAVHVTPVFHAMGLFVCFWAGLTGFIRAVTNPRQDSPPMSPENLLQQIDMSGSTLVFTVPMFIEAWNTDPLGVEMMKKMKAIYWGGAPLNVEVGRTLHEQNVMIHPLYGATEFGLVSRMPAKPHPEGYEWFQLPPSTSPVFIPEDEERVFELIFKESPTHHLCVYNTEIDGVPAYASNDLMEQHPSNPKLVRIKGRKDDQIMLSTGEKTNPGPLEDIINRNPHIKSSIMFGRGRSSNGIIVEPVSYDESEMLGVAGFRNLIWSSVEEANDFAPGHSKIFKEMILISLRSKPFTYTLKQNARRGAVLADYASEIDAIYKAVEDSTHTDIPIPTGSNPTGGWTLEESLAFVRKAVRAVMVHADGMKDDDDLFASGCDSLQATYIRNTLLHALRQVAPSDNVKKIPTNFLYQYPSISELANIAAQISRPSGIIPEVDRVVERYQRLHNFVEKYTQDWPVHQPLNDNSDPTHEIILLTGSTGGLGSQLLAQLIAMPSVARIYAFNRPGKKSSRERHLDVFEDRGNDIVLLDSNKLVYVEGDTSVKGLSIDPNLFAEIRDSATTIIHNAWRVDFNLSLVSFESAIQGVRNLVDLALNSPHPEPPRLLFTSSIGIVKPWVNIPPVAEDSLSEIELVSYSGYGESKWVSERILWAAAQVTPLRPVIIRVGQMSGGINGNWNVREWFPAMARASQVVGGVPQNKGLVSYLPVHIAASALIELRHSPNLYAHLVHPRPILWSSIINYLAEVLKVPVIPYDEWLARLEASPRTDEALRRNPALHLIDFYRASAPSKEAEREDRETMGLAIFDTKLTEASAPSLGPDHLPQLAKTDVDSWVRYWRSKGALDP